MRRYQVRLDQHTYEVEVLEHTGSSVRFKVGNRDYTVSASPILSAPSAQVVASMTPIAAATPVRAQGKPGEIVAPMPGIVVRLPLPEGTEVAAGQTIAVIEAMKMENNIEASRAGKIKQLKVKEGEEVQHGQFLMSIG